MCIGQELSYDAGFGNDLAVVDDGRDETARVDGEVVRVSGDGEVDDLFCKRETEFCEGNMGAVGPGAAMVGVEGDRGFADVRFAVGVTVGRHF